MKKYILLLFVLISSLSYAQPGYRGKTVYINYESGSSISLLSPTYNGKVNGVGYNMTHSFAIHKVVSRKHDLAPYFTFHRSAFVPSYVEDGEIEGSSPYKLNNYTFGFNYRIFINTKRKWGLAPIGSYMDVKPFVSMMDLKYVPNDESSDKLYRLTTPGIALGFGRQKVLFEKITFNYGFQFSLPFDIVRNASIDDADSLLFGDPFYPDDKSREDAFIHSARSRNFFKTTFQIKIGIGFLAF